jgi:hypothetical protein
MLTPEDIDRRVSAWFGANDGYEEQWEAWSDAVVMRDPASVTEGILFSLVRTTHPGLPITLLITPDGKALLSFGVGPCYAGESLAEAFLLTLEATP